MITLSVDIGGRVERTTGPGVLLMLEQMKPLPPGVKLKLMLDAQCLCRCSIKEVGTVTSGKAAAAMCRLLDEEGKDVTVIVGRNL